jgi:hypothetical protein
MVAFGINGVSVAVGIGVSVGIGVGGWVAVGGITVAVGMGVGSGVAAPHPTTLVAENTSNITAASFGKTLRNFGDFIPASFFEQTNYAVFGMQFQAPVCYDIPLHYSF